MNSGLPWRNTMVCRPACLNVTTDPDVALWFAIHKDTRWDSGRCVDYESAGGAGYVYPLQVIAEPRHIIPLSAFFFDGDTDHEGSRPPY